MPVPPPSFAELLRTLREGAGLTQEDLAELALSGPGGGRLRLAT